MTLAQQNGITEFPYIIKDNNGNELYFENSDGYWEKHEYDSNDKLIYYEDSNGFWSKFKYDSSGNIIYYEKSNGYWYKQEYDSNGNCIHYEDSKGSCYDYKYDSDGNYINFENPESINETKLVFDACWDEYGIDSRITFNYNSKEKFLSDLFEKYDDEYFKNNNSFRLFDSVYIEQKELKSIYTHVFTLDEWFELNKETKIFND